MHAVDTPRLGLEELVVIAGGLDHPEGIAAAPDGSVYVGGEAGQLYRLDEEWAVEPLLATGGFTLGLAADAHSRLYACDSKARCVRRIDPRSGSVEVFASGDGRRAMRTPNWGAFDREGNYYVSDSGTWKAGDGCIWLVAAGERPRVWSEACRDFPNGLCVAADGSGLYVLESTPGRLWLMPFAPDGAAAEPRLLCDLAGFVPDGVAECVDGSLVIACYRPDVVLRWHPHDGLEVLAHDPEGTILAAPTNVAFAGAERDVMLVPNIGRWHLTKLVVRGLRGVPLHYPTSTQLGG
jgi:gluconolactonase